MSDFDNQTADTKTDTKTDNLTPAPDMSITITVNLVRLMEFFTDICTASQEKYQEPPVVLPVVIDLSAFEDEGCITVGGFVNCPKYVTIKNEKTKRPHTKDSDFQIHVHRHVDLKYQLASTINELMFQAIHRTSKTGQANNQFFDLVFTQETISVESTDGWTGRTLIQSAYNGKACTIFNKN